MEIIYVVLCIFVCQDIACIFCLSQEGNLYMFDTTITEIQFVFECKKCIFICMK